MKITVNQGDIDRGIPRSYRHSPVSLALSRACGRVMSVGLLSIGGFAWDSSDPRWQVDLPLDVADKIDRHDQGGEMEPFSFEVEVPEPAGVA